VDILLGDASRARKALGWEPKVSFRELVHMMVDADLRLAEQERMLRGADAGTHAPSPRGETA
jgi:GDPmannose 4,6-dehydratase